MLTVLLFSALAQGADLQALYDNKQYKEVVQVLENQPNKGAREYYNLGNAYYRLQKYGLALAQFEFAKLVAPGQEDVLHNLSLTRERVAARVGASRMDPPRNAFLNLLDQTPRWFLHGLCALSLIFLGFQAVLSLWRHRALRPMLRLPKTLSTVAICATLSVLLALQLWAHHQALAICINEGVIRSGPGHQFLHLANHLPGIKVRLTGLERTNSKEEIWSQISFSMGAGKGALGWMPRSALLPLVLPSHKDKL